MTSCQNYSQASITSRLNPSCSSGAMFSVSLCLFLSISDTSINGGAIYISGAFSFDVNQSLFKSCHAYMGGGVACYSHTAMSFVRCCFYQTYGTLYGMACYSQPASGSLVSMVSNSAVYCPGAAEGARTVFDLFYSNTTYSLNNISNCKMTEQCFVNFYYAVGPSATQSQIANCIGDFTIVFTSCTGYFSQGNIVNNTEISSSMYVFQISSVSSLLISYCAFISNTYQTLCSAYSGVTFSNNAYYSSPYSVSSAATQPTTLALKVGASWICQIPTSRFTSEGQILQGSLLILLSSAIFINEI